MNIVDKKGRDIIVFNKKGDPAIARFPDLDEAEKEYMVEVYVELTGEDPDKVMKFLNYESDENEFCS